MSRRGIDPPSGVSTVRRNHRPPGRGGGQNKTKGEEETDLLLQALLLPIVKRLEGIVELGEDVASLMNIGFGG